MESIYKVNDKVYDIFHGWGEVIEVIDDTIFGVIVKFEDNDRTPNYEASYTYDGKLYLAAEPTLSFTKYTLNGFTNIRLPEVGQVIYVKNLAGKTSYPDNNWHVRRFHSITEDGHVRTTGQRKLSDVTIDWQTWSITNPLLD